MSTSEREQVLARLTEAFCMEGDTGAELLYRLLQYNSSHSLRQTNFAQVSSSKLFVKSAMSS